MLCTVLQQVARVVLAVPQLAETGLLGLTLPRSSHAPILRAPTPRLVQRRFGLGSLSGLPHNLIGSALSLLLVFRTNTAYAPPTAGHFCCRLPLAPIAQVHADSPPLTLSPPTSTFPRTSASTAQVQTLRLTLLPPYRYTRFWEGRQRWQMLSDHVRTLSRLCMLYREQMGA